MNFSTVESIIADQALPLAGLALFVLIAVAVLHRRQRAQNRRLSTALDNMSQGLNMFDAQGRITLLNRRYLEMYSLSPDVIKPGVTLRQLIEHRISTGLLSGDPDAYCKRIMDGIAKGQSTPHYVQASDGRIVLAKNEPMADGGWVSTHEDVTEQRQAEQERAAIREHEQRRAAIDAAISAFRPLVEGLLSRVSGSAATMRDTAGKLFGSSDQTSQRADGAVGVSFVLAEAPVGQLRPQRIDPVEPPAAHPHRLDPRLMSHHAEARAAECVAVVPFHVV
jgi:PAS domain S-box-containing protein